MPSTNKRILLLGSTGFLGKNLYQEFTQNGFEVICPVRVKKRIQTKLVLPNCDSAKFDFIVNAAGYYSRSINPIQIYKLRSGNYKLMRQIAKFRKKHGGCLISFGSYFEHCPRNSNLRKTPYYYYKRKGFNEIRKSALLSDSPTFYIYLYDTYGLGDRRGKVLDLIIREFKSGRFPALNTPSQSINWTNSYDVCKDLMLLIETYEKYMPHNLNEFQIRSKDEYFLLDFIRLLDAKLNGIYELESIPETQRKFLWDCAPDLPSSSAGERVRVLEFATKAILDN